MSIRSLILGVTFTIVSTLSALAQSEPSARANLIMVEEVGCIWCARWNTEISDIYPKTPEGQAAPLVRMDIHSPYPDRLELASKPRFTPTFILVVDNEEVSRLEGYPGEDFFWGLLGRMLENANIDVSK